MKLEQILAMHVDPRIPRNSMVYEVWQDGEVTITKSGDLFRRRILHCLIPETGDDAIDPNLMPERLGKNGSICVLTHEDAIIIRDWITAQRPKKFVVQHVPSDDTEGGEI